MKVAGARVRLVTRIRIRTGARPFSYLSNGRSILAKKFGRSILSACVLYLEIAEVGIVYIIWVSARVFVCIVEMCAPVN